MLPTRHRNPRPESGLTTCNGSTRSLGGQHRRDGRPRARVACAQNEAGIVIEDANEVQFRDWLTLQLRARRMSLRQLAHRSGVNVSTVSRIVRGERRPTLRTAVRLARVVRESADEPSATRFFGSLTPESLDPVREVERALRADEQMDDEDIRRVMQVYLGARRADPASGPTRRTAPA
jgi:transcriptional regulator with XRE-family HTH domain